MAIIKNIEKNAMFELELLSNRYLDIKKGRTNFENWIPFILKLTTYDKVYEYSEEQGATFTLFEIKDFITKLEDIVKLKEQNLEITRYEFSSSEGYFDFIIYDTLEENEAYIEIWMNTALNSEGVIFGYDEGVRVVITLDCLNYFKNELKNKLYKILDLSLG